MLIKIIFLCIINISFAVDSCNFFKDFGQYTVEGSTSEHILKIQIYKPAVFRYENNDVKIYDVYGEVILDTYEKFHFTACSEDIRSGKKIILLFDLSLKLQKSFHINSINLLYNKPESFSDLSSILITNNSYSPLIDLSSLDVLADIMSKLVWYKLTFVNGNTYEGVGILYQNSLIVYATNSIQSVEFEFKGKRYIIVNLKFVNATKFKNELVKINLVNVSNDNFSELQGFNTKNIIEFLDGSYVFLYMLDFKNKVADNSFYVIANQNNHYVGLIDFTSINLLSLEQSENFSSIYMYLITYKKTNLLSKGMVLLKCRIYSKTVKCKFWGQLVKIISTETMQKFEFSFFNISMCRNYPITYEGVVMLQNKPEVNADNTQSQQLTSEADLEPAPKRIKIN